ncbi:MAG: nuclease A inhibitor family protein [Acidobacteriota bacterium]
MTDPHDPKALAAAIGVACKGLVYMSETDAPIEPFFVQNVGDEPIADILKKHFSGECSEADPDEFFARLTADQDWHTPLQKRTVKKFRALRNVLRSNLADLRIYRFGRIRIDILVVGREVTGDLAGIQTRAVET